jgi:hypothetical protein
MLSGNDRRHLMHRGDAHHLMAGGVQQMHDVSPRNKVAVGEPCRLEPLKHHIGVFHLGHLKGYGRDGLQRLLHGELNGSQLGIAGWDGDFLDAKRS